VSSTSSDGRALFDRFPRLTDLVPFTPLADGLPTPLEQIGDRLWVKRDDLTSSVYGGNKVRKLEHVLAVAQRRGGPVVTAGGVGSHHVLATAIHARRLGLEVEAVLFPQPETDDVRDTRAALADLGGVRTTMVASPYLMPVGIARRLAALAPRRPYLVWPGASTPIGTLGYVGAGLELAASGVEEPDVVVVALGSGGSAVGIALGVLLGGWEHARVLAVRAADAVATNAAVLRALEAGTSALLALGGWMPRPARWEVDPSWFGPGYGHPTAAGDEATASAAAVGLTLEPTYTAKAFAAALVQPGRTIFVHTFAGESRRVANRYSEEAQGTKVKGDPR
jgi:D-cysteine desulfhydrase